MKHSIFLSAIIIILFSNCKKDELTPDKAKTNLLSADQSKENQSLELIYKDSLYQLTGVAISKSGRLFTNYPLWKGPHKYDVVEVTSLHTSRPYPDAKWNSWKIGEEGSKKWVCVQAVYIDDANRMWIVDPASPYMKGVYQHDYKLVQINLATNQVERIYKFNYVADEGSYINDVRVDVASNFAYLTNSSEGGILVVDLATGKMRQVLQGDPSVISSPFYKFTIDGKEFKYDYGEPVKFNSDGIALTPDVKYLYYKPLTDDRLYRIQTKYLKNFSLTSPQVALHVEFVGHFTTTDGMIFDKKGNLYLGDLENSKIIRIDKSGSLTAVIEDKRLIWPDSYAVTDEGYLYISCSQIQKQPEYNTSQHLPGTPYAIYRIKLPGY